MSLPSSRAMLNGWISIGIGFIVVGSFSLVLSPTIARCNAFSMLQSSLTVSFSGAAFYFYTDGKAQYLEGPHFTPYFYNTIIGIVGAGCSMIGVWLYHKYMSSWSYRYLIVASNLFVSFLCLVDILQFARISRQLGIPDHVFMMSSSALEGVAYMWTWLPQVLLYSFLCPKGMEATMFALLAGCSNIGSVISQNAGAMLLHIFHCEPRGALSESAQFKNLWIVALISTLLPLVVILMSFWLIPDVKQGDAILSGDLRDDATAGSLWRRWCDRSTNVESRRSSSSTDPFSG
eukprot:TRINITY_DN23792_c1_g1_i2.p1 TRINITY_DN23792_c1_g1~~TRINITY_DN23792_c1_g1_i2.p1  ORF type:complete len:290 (-),score=25.56 TRINITY_DN23792_c1_g1_i2:204-1073(-)